MSKITLSLEEIENERLALLETIARLGRNIDLDARTDHLNSEDMDYIIKKLNSRRDRLFELEQAEKAHKIN